jgi:hypothetical protein
MTVLNKSGSGRSKFHGRNSFPCLLIVTCLAALAVLIPRGATGLERPDQARGDVRGSQLTTHTILAQARQSGKPRSDDTAPKPADDRRSKDSATDSVWRSEDIELLGVGMSVGDVDGDGKNEIVIIDPTSVYVYRLSEGRLHLLAEYGSGNLELKSVDVAKIRGSGPPRIYVTAQNRGALASFVLELSGGKLTPVITDFPYYLRVINYPTRGPILLGQQKGLNRVYEGPIYQLTDKGNALEVLGRFGVPLKIPIFGFAIGDLEGKRKPVIAVYDKQDHLRVYDPTGKRLYVSHEYYGGSDVVLRLGGPTERTGRLDDENKEFFRPRVMSVDLDNDSVYEVIALTHASKTGRYLSRTKMLEEGQVVSLKWNGDVLIPVWSTAPVQGMITDFAIDTLPGLTGRRLIVLERKKTDWLSFLRSTSQVKAYLIETLMADGLKHDQRKKD